jgi:hypothetical protein
MGELKPTLIKVLHKHATYVVITASILSHNILFIVYAN